MGQSLPEAKRPGTSSLAAALAARGVGRASVVLLTGTVDARDELRNALHVVLSPGASHLEVIAALASVVDSRLPARLQLAALLHGGVAAHTAAVLGRDPRLRAFEAVRLALCHLAEAGGAVVVFGGAHLATDDAVELLSFLAQDALRPAGVFGVGRSAPRAALVFAVPTAGPELLQRLGLEHGAVREVALDSVQHTAESLLARPALLGRLGQLAATAPHGLDALDVLLPRSVEELADLQVARLAHDARQILLAADLVGAPLAAASLASLAAPDGAGRFALERLRRDGWLVGAESGRELALAPWAVGLSARHPVSTELRHDVALHLVHSYLSQRSPMALERALLVEPRVALAGVGLSTLLSAADGLAAAGQYAGARSLLQAALRVASPAEQGALWLALADVAALAGQLPDALEALAAVGAASPLTSLRVARLEAHNGASPAAVARLTALLSGAELSAEQRGRVTLELGELALRAGDVEGARAWARDVLESADHEASADTLRRLEAHNLLGKAAFWAARYDEAVAEYSRVHEAATGRLRGVALHNLGLVAMRRHQVAEAVARLTAASAEFEASHDHYEGAVCLHNLGLAYELDQRYSLAGPVFQRAIDLLERFGTPQSLLGAVNSLADLQLAIGELWRARRLFTKVRRSAGDGGLEYVQRFAELRLAELDRIEGDVVTAHHEAARLAPLFEASGHVEDAREAHLLAARAASDLAPLHLQAAAAVPHTEVAARALIERGRREPALRAAVRLLDEAALVLEQLGQRPPRVEALSALAARLVKAGRVAEASEYAGTGLAVLTELRARVPDASHDAFAALPWVREAQLAFDACTQAPEAPTSTRPTAPPAATAAPVLGMVGTAPALRRVQDMIERVGPTPASVLITGESGTGKELVAQALASCSGRAGKPFIRVNAAAFADSLLESELFGHERGAFTGAAGRRIGAFEQADGGTLFLDEIGDISPKTQVSLLRVLQSGEVRRVGGTESLRVDVRVITATHRDLDAAVRDGSFRLDLLYRIRGVELALPSLRDRGASDLALLTAHILGRLSDEHGCAAVVDEAAMALFTTHAWPGNVRELENVLRSAYFFAQERVIGGQRRRVITADDLRTYTTLKHGTAPLQPGTHVNGAPSGAFDDIVRGLDPSTSGRETLPSGFDLNETKRLIEIRCIERALEQAGGNISKAAELLGLKRPRLSQKIKEYGLKEPGYPGGDGD